MNSDGPPPSHENAVPRWLMWFYITLPIWGIVCLFLYWNGSAGGWFDRGYWQQLQRAANTTIPFINHSETE